MFPQGRVPINILDEIIQSVQRKAVPTTSSHSRDSACQNDSASNVSHDINDDLDGEKGGTSRSSRVHSSSPPQEPSDEDLEWGSSPSPTPSYDRKIRTDLLPKSSLQEDQYHERLEDKPSSRDHQQYPPSSPPCAQRVSPPLPDSKDEDSDLEPSWPHGLDDNSMYG
jgi:hypothetical protein